jgi:hypothetical protein
LKGYRLEVADGRPFPFRIPSVDAASAAHG